MAKRMVKLNSPVAWDKAVGLIFVMAMHAVILGALWHYQIKISPAEAVTVFVNFISPPAPVKQEEPPKAEKPRPIERPKLKQLVAEAPAPAEFVAPAPPPEPVIEEPAAPSPPEPVIEAPPTPPAPVTLSSELAVSCPERTPPFYPAASRRLGEQGRVVLRVELDDTGRVGSVVVSSGSGFRRLDDAALAAVKKWRCDPVTRDGTAVYAVASQQFDFILKGR